jgi:ribose transport system ATP-binding protein
VTTALTLEGVSKRYGETRALENLSLQFETGTVHTVFGENGSGKSTLVKILSGIVIPDRGKVEVSGRIVNHFSPMSMRRLGIVPVLQEVLVAPNVSVLDNIFMGYDGLFRRRLSRSARIELARSVLARITRTQLHLDQPVETVPLPYQQLIVIARALIHDPYILILDESTAALDIGDRDILFSAIKEFVGRGRLVIFISHRMDEVTSLSDVVTVLRSGMLVASLPRAEVTVPRLLSLVSPETAHEVVSRTESANVSF